MNKDVDILIELYRNYYGEVPINYELITGSGSSRLYYRLFGKNFSTIATYGSNKLENRAFIEFTKLFTEKKLNVPKILTISDDKNCYLQEDLGNIDLLSYLINEKKHNPILQNSINFYKRSIDELLRLQIIGHKDINYDLCFPRKEFDKTSMFWDLNYFKYYFLKMYINDIDENILESEFTDFCNFLNSIEKKYFMLRDCQARNIIIFENNPYFIDYQGGRLGAIQYDLASLLFQAKADLSDENRIELSDYYFQQLNKYVQYPQKDFYKFYEPYVLIRILQTLGAYGFRGIIQRKEHFIESIPNALDNAIAILTKNVLPINLKLIFKYLIQIKEQINHSFL